MTNEEDNGGGSKNSGSSGGGSGGGSGGSCSTSSIGDGQKALQADQQYPNGDASFGNGDSGMAGGGCSGQEDYSDKTAKESDPLQPKMVKSKSLNKVKEPKESKEVSCPEPRKSSFESIFEKILSTSSRKWSSFL